MKRTPKRRQEPGRSAPWWVAVVVGSGLVLFPEPATTATGLAILATAFAYDRARDP